MIKADIIKSHSVLSKMFSVCLSVVSVLVVVSLMPAVRAQAPAIVEGTVVQSSSGQPLADAKVQLFRTMPVVPASGPPPENADLGRLSATTKQDGRFIFEGVPAGEYRLIASRTGGFVPAEFGQHSPASPGSSFELTPGQRMRGIQLSLTPTGSIAGRVYDRDGPVGGVQVQARRPIYRDGRRGLIIAQSVRTNDRGEYRLFWLSPGSYYVTATVIADQVQRQPVDPVHISEPARSGGFEQATPPVVSSRTLPTGEVIEQTQLAVYYPGTTSAESAARIDLRAGGNAEGLDISIVAGAVRGHHVRGVVSNGPTGQPVPDASILAVPRSSDPALVIPAARTNPDGSFDMSGVAPGAYVLLANNRNAAASAGVALQVGDGDVNNLTLTMTPGFRLSGRFVIDGRSRDGDDVNAANLRLTLRRDPDLVGMPESGPTFSPPPSADGSFVLEGVQVGDFRAAVRALPIDAYIRSMRMGAADVLEKGLHLASAPRDALEVVIAVNAGRLTGTVVNARQEPVPNSTVVAVPDTPDRDRTDLYKSTSSDPSGHFRLRGLAAGSYKVFAWEVVEDGAWQDPEFIRTIENRGTSIRIRDGNDENVQVTVIPDR